MFLLSRATACTCTVFAFNELNDDDDDDDDEFAIVAQLVSIESETMAQKGSNFPSLFSLVRSRPRPNMGCNH